MERGDAEEKSETGVGGGAGAFGRRAGGKLKESRKDLLDKEARDGAEDAREPSDPALSELDGDVDAFNFPTSWDGVQNKKTPRIALLTAVTNGLVDLEEASFARFIAFAQASAPMVPAELRQRFADTAYSSPSVRTGDDGKATIDVDLPDNLTEWRVNARGASAGPLVGEDARHSTRRSASSCAPTLRAS